jgi:hypothetical protein
MNWRNTERSGRGLTDALFWNLPGEIGKQRQMSAGDTGYTGRKSNYASPENIS